MWIFRRRKTREQDLDRELRAHLELEAEEQREAGLATEEAGCAAQRAFGNQTLTKENVREAWGFTYLETLAQDLRYAFRSLLASPVFALVAIASLGLGIGANTAIFSFVNALLLQKLPVPEPERLVALAEPQNANMGFSLPTITELDKHDPAFSGVLGRFLLHVNLTGDGAAERLDGEVVTGKYFSTLQIKPAVGRLLTEDDVFAGEGNPVCVISYDLWQSHFGGDARIVGRKIMLNSHPYVVVGVTQKGFLGTHLRSKMDLQIPVSRAGDFMNGPLVSMWKSSDFSWLEPLARLRPGVTIAQAQAMSDPVVREIKMRLANPEQRAKMAGQKFGLRLSDGSQGLRSESEYTEPVMILMGVVGLVLLIACANVANLLLARAVARSREFAVRLSLGASRARLMRQLMVESLVLASGGGALGLAFAVWMMRMLTIYLNAGLRPGDGVQATLDLKVIAFSILLSAATALLFGLMPAWQSARPGVMPELKGSGEQLTAAKLRKALVVFEIALSMVILFAGGLMTQTLSHLRTIDLGFQPERVIMLRLDPRMAGYSAAQSDGVFDEVLARLRARPGVIAASEAVVTPLEGSMISLYFKVPGRVEKSSDQQTNFNMVSGQYFKTLNQTLLAGREFDERDAKTAPRVAIVNQLFAQQYMPGENPVGRHFEMGGGAVEIVGMVKNSYYQALREKICPLVYLPVKQTENSGYTVLVRTKLTEPQALAQIKDAIRSVDRNLPVYGTQEMSELIDEGLTSEKVLTFLSMLFSGLVTLLCCMGVYGLIAYAVSRRTREIGVRFAIGAQKSDVAKLFLRESGLLIALGVVAGVPLALAAARILKSFLFGVKATDGVVLGTSVAIFLCAGLLASVFPVRKAIRIEPSQALRYE